MDIATMHFWGKTKYWWALIITGILMIPCGLWLWFQPALGYEVLSLLLGWLLILFGIVQLIVSGNVKQKAPPYGERFETYRIIPFSPTVPRVSKNNRRK